MGAGTKAGQERRRALVATFHAVGMGPQEIAKACNVAERTVLYDLKAIREGKFLKATPAQMSNEVGGVASFVLQPVMALLSAQTEPAVRVMAARAVWEIYKQKVLLEQTLGLVPKEPEKIELTTEIGERLEEYLTAVASRLSNEARLELARAMENVNAEVPKLAAALPFLTR